MFKTLSDLFKAVSAPLAEAGGRAAEDAEHQLRLATAVLMVEVMRADSDVSETERATVIDALREKFALRDDEVARLFELAQTTSRDAPDLYAFTSRINKGFELDRKLRMVEYLWQIAFADGTLSHHENHLMLKLGDLLYIPRGEFVAAKQRARAAAGLAPDPS
ncbi:MAG: TerB family tellurite resistance protein [Rhodocyclaceae bacterium]